MGTKVVFHEKVLRSYVEMIDTVKVKNPGRDIKLTIIYDDDTHTSGEIRLSFYSEED